MNIEQITEALSYSDDDVYIFIHIYLYSVSLIMYLGIILKTLIYDRYVIECSITNQLKIFIVKNIFLFKF